MTVKEEVLFNASNQEVWDLLTKPEMTKQYMFGCELISDWEVGSTIDWKGKTEDGTEVIYVTGKVLEYQEGKKVISTTFDPNSGMRDIPENHVELSYELRAVEAGTILTISQGDFSKAENGKQRYEESLSGWVDLVIPLMKKLLSK